MKPYLTSPACRYAGLASEQNRLQGNSQRRGACYTLIYTTGGPLLPYTGERNDRAGLERVHSLFVSRSILPLYIAMRATTPSDLPRAFG